MQFFIFVTFIFLFLILGRAFGKTKRAVTPLEIMVIAGLFYWFALPYVQWLIIPKSPGGANGP